MTAEPRARKIVEPGIDWVDGVPVMKDKGTYSDATASRLATMLGLLVLEHGLGFTFGHGAGYQYPALDDGRLRFTDISFVRTGRFPGGRLPEGWITFAPGLIVDAASPNDSVKSVVDRARTWLNAGARMAWVVYPRARTLLVMRPGTPDSLFSIRFGDIFPRARASNAGVPG